MASGSAISCPTCHQQNTAEMAFCIFCGGSLKGLIPVPEKDSFAARLAEAESEVLSAAEGDNSDALRVCPKCNSADPLNNSFCIICGTRIPYRERSAGVTSSVMVQSELLSLKQDISTIQASVGTTAVAPAARSPALVVFSLLALLGLAVGAGGGYVQLRQPEAVPPLILPSHGLAILTAKPFSDLFLEYPDRRNFLIGRTGSTGSVCLDIDPEPTAYQVTLTSDDGRSIHAPAAIQAGKPTVLGGPPGPKLLDTVEGN